MARSLNDNLNNGTLDHSNYILEISINAIHNVIGLYTGRQSSPAVA